MTARKTLVGSGFEGQRPNPDEEKIPDHFGDESQEPKGDEPAPEHEGITGEPPPAPDSKDSELPPPKRRRA